MASLILFLALFGMPGVAGGYVGGVDAQRHTQDVDPNSGKPIIRNGG